jgi:type II secretory pathway pseudopilin PulG
MRSTVAVLRGQKGALLAELLIATSIIGVLMALVGGALYQTNTIQRSWQDDSVATRDLRHAGSWFAGDALNAQTTTLVDGQPAVSAVTFTWTDGDDVAHTANYAVSGTDLLRTYDGTAMVVARDVTAFQASLSSKTVNLALTVAAEQGTTDTVNLQTYLRSLP